MTRTATGFVIQLPKQAPVPTPTIHRGRLYTGGGFSSKEFYCFDAKTGKLVWGLTLDDDGPSFAVAHDDSVLFNTESCTIFVVSADTGKLRWSYWLGDPLMFTPTVSAGRVFTAYPAKPAAKSDAAKTEIGQETAAAPALPRPAHALACFDLASGAVVWQKWIDGDCMSAPVASGDELFVATLAGTLYVFRQADGEILAHKLRATSAPVVAGQRVFLTRRADADTKEGKPAEEIVSYERKMARQEFFAARRAAPYLDRQIQEASEATDAAADFESQNGIGGGFGGGFGGGSGFLAPPGRMDRLAGIRGLPMNLAGPEVQSAEDAHGSSADDPLNESSPPDALAAQQQAAADLIGLGNVSTLQGFQGSRLLNWRKRNYNCMGDLLICTSAATGEKIWSHKLAGNLERQGGHLAAPPVAAGDWVFAATLSGDVLQIDPRSGGIRKTWPIGSPTRFSPVVAEGRIYVGTQDGKIVCLDTGDRSPGGWPTLGGDAAHSNVVRPKEE